MRKHTKKPSREYALIEDGSQFFRVFWETEQLELSKIMDKRHARHPEFGVQPVPTPEDLQMQFIKWLLARPHIPPLAAPASSGFYDEVFNCGNRNASLNSNFFDDAYVTGQRRNLLCRDNDDSMLNPALHAFPSYNEVCTATLTSVSEIEHHERCIYQPGYTPRNIRTNIQRMLQDSNPKQHMVDFQEKDIPPPNRDLCTHRILTDLLQKRNNLDRDFDLPPSSVAVNGNLLDATAQFEREYLQRDEEYNQVNRDMLYTPTPLTSFTTAIFCRTVDRHSAICRSSRPSNWKPSKRPSSCLNPINHRTQP
jgi:hypothetical protein